MTDKRINEILELKKNLEKHDLTLDQWLFYTINDNILEIRLELVHIRKLVEEMGHTVILGL